MLKNTFDILSDCHRLIRILNLWSSGADLFYIGTTTLCNTKYSLFALKKAFIHF